MRELEEQVREVEDEQHHVSFISNLGFFPILFFFYDKKILSYSVISVAGLFCKLGI